MAKLARILVSVLAAGLSGYAGLLVVLIFGPLVFPATPSGTSFGENAVAVGAMLFLLLFGAAGWVLCWKFTRRFVKQEETSIRAFTDFPDR
jgi:uncharacterized RDD family membrane protein YckC